MFKLLASLKTFLKSQNVLTDSAIFRLHNVFTTVLLLGCSMVITANQFVGNPIYCLVDLKPWKSFINTYCWITSTFTMPDAYQRQVSLPRLVRVRLRLRHRFSYLKTKIENRSLFLFRRSFITCPNNCRLCSRSTKRNSGC